MHAFWIYFVQSPFTLNPIIRPKLNTRKGLHILRQPCLTENEKWILATQLPLLSPKTAPSQLPLTPKWL